MEVTGNETFDSNLMVRLPQVVPIMRDIENSSFHEQVSKLSRLVNHMFSNTTSTNVHLNRIIIYTDFNCIGKAVETKSGFIMLINAGVLSPAFSLNRIIFELWAAAHFVGETMLEFRNTRDEEKLSKIARRLFAGSRYPANLPWGTPSTDQPIHVNDMLRALYQNIPGTENTYNFLCEYCHPNFLYNMEMYIAGNIEGAWNNPKFVESVTASLEKQFDALNQALYGIADSSEGISNICLEEYGINLQ
jgi:hypothetical protein